MPLSPKDDEVCSEPLCRAADLDRWYPEGDAEPDAPGLLPLQHISLEPPAEALYRRAIIHGFRRFVPSLDRHETCRFLGLNSHHGDAGPRSGCQLQRRPDRLAASIRFVGCSQDVS
jgi:hypothetical protein